MNAAAAPNLVQQLRESGLEVSLREGTDADIRALDHGRRTNWSCCASRTPSASASARASPRPVQLYSDGSDSEAGKHAARVAPAVAGYSRARRAACACRRAAFRPTVVQPVVIDDIDVSTPSARATLLLGMLSYVILLATLMGGLYLAIDATAGERERGSLESLLTLPVVREHLIYGKIAATTVMMLVCARLRRRRRSPFR